MNASKLAFLWYTRERLSKIEARSGDDWSMNIIGDELIEITWGVPNTRMELSFRFERDWAVTMVYVVIEDGKTIETKVQSCEFRYLQDKCMHLLLDFDPLEESIRKSIERAEEEMDD